MLKYKIPQIVTLIQEINVYYENNVLPLSRIKNITR